MALGAIDEGRHIWSAVALKNCDAGDFGRRVSDGSACYDEWHDASTRYGVHLVLHRRAAAGVWRVDYGRWSVRTVQSTRAPGGAGGPSCGDLVGWTPAGSRYLLLCEIPSGPKLAKYCVEKN